MADTHLDPAPKPPEFWRRTPPALFPALFGLLGLGLAWRAAAAAFGGSIPPAIGEAVLAIAGLLYLFSLSSYVSKFSYRPKVLLEDIMSPPGRAGAASMTMGLFAFAAALVPYVPLFALIVMWAGLLAHLAMAACAVLVMRQQERGLKVTPAWHLSFVGFILAPLVAAPLGLTGLSWMILSLTLVSAVLIYAVSALQMRQESLPAAQRPLLVVHLAPVSLFATVCALLGAELAAYAFVVLAVGLGATLFSRAGALVQDGISPLWGAFTFPVAALATALFVTSQFAGGLAWLGLVPLLIGTVIIPAISVWIILLWLRGELATMTGASMA